jgi:glycerol-3-phosphate dehydrogenase (NAD+)
MDMSMLAGAVTGGATNAGLPSAEVEKIKVAVLAAGSFGMAMAILAARRNHEVVIYARDEATVRGINVTHHNPKVFSEFELPSNIRATTSVAEAAKDAKIIISCLPAQLTPDFLQKHKDDIPTDAILTITSKGLYLKTKQLLSIPILEALGREQPLAFLSGPSFALELMKNVPSAVVVASKLLYHAVYVQRHLSTIDFRVYSSQDIIGVQLGGALKNPLAIGAGMIEGAGYGINTLAAYVTRSSMELQKLCVAMGGQPTTISGLAGIGDLMLTAFGSLSRNRTFGMRVMQGEKAEDILKTTTVEGVPTAEVAVFFADQCGLDLPIFKAVNAMLKGQIKKEELQDLLMNRPLKSET